MWPKNMWGKLVQEKLGGKKNAESQWVINVGDLGLDITDLAQYDE